MTLFLEIIAGFTLLGLIAKYKKTEKEVYGTYCLCYTKDKHATYVPHKTITCETLDEYETETEKIVRLAFDQDKNVFLKEKGVTGIALVNLDDGREEYWCMLI